MCVHVWCWQVEEATRVLFEREEDVIGQCYVFVCVC